MQHELRLERSNNAPTILALLIGLAVGGIVGTGVTHARMQERYDKLNAVTAHAVDELDYTTHLYLRTEDRLKECQRRSGAD